MGDKLIDANRTIPAAPSPSLISTRLGEELPVFCERCGYSLHGLPQVRCEHCTILQFHCPECGHHQPINTLRPAAQKLLGRIRGGWLALVIFFKLNLFGWLLFAWVGMGVAWSYRFDYDTAKKIHDQNPQSTTWIEAWAPAKFGWESGVAFGLFAWALGMVWRMALLRWKRGWAVGLVLASLIMGCIALGVLIRQIGMRQEETLPSAYNHDFLGLMSLAFVSLIFGAATIWPIWLLLVHAFLPTRTASALLNWQLSQSNQVSGLARD